MQRRSEIKEQRIKTSAAANRQRIQQCEQRTTKKPQRTQRNRQPVHLVPAAGDQLHVVGSVSDREDSDQSAIRERALIQQVPATTKQANTEDKR